MLRYAIKITGLAEKDLENAGDYILHAFQSPSAAENTIQGIRCAIEDLETFPESHELDEDIHLAELGVRKTYYKDYKIFYIVDRSPRTVYIVRILHMLVDSRRMLYRTFHISI